MALNSNKDYLEKVELLNRYARAYYVDDAPLVPDYEYDRLYLELETYEQAHPDEVVPYSPTLRVGGAALKEFASVEHKVPLLLSLIHI